MTSWLLNMLWLGTGERYVPWWQRWGKDLQGYFYKCIEGANTVLPYVELSQVCHKYIFSIVFIYRQWRCLIILQKNVMLCWRSINWDVRMSTCSAGEKKSFNTPKVHYLFSWILLNYMKPFCLSIFAAVCLSPCVHASVSLCSVSIFYNYRTKRDRDVQLV